VNSLYRENGTRPLKTSYITIPISGNDPLTSPNPGLQNHKTPTTEDLTFITSPVFSSVPFHAPDQSTSPPPLPPPLSSSSSTFLENRGFGWLLEVENSEEAQVPLLEELDIDIYDIIYKVRSIVFPYNIDKDSFQNSPDFWGPLLIVMLYSFLLIWGQLSVISWVLTVWLFGSFLLFLLIRMLGADVSYSLCVGVVGYSLLPLVLQ